MRLSRGASAAILPILGRVNMERKEYNGWTNYETWLVNLWMDNDEGSQANWRGVAIECIEAADDQDEAEGKLADQIKEEHEQRAEEATGENGWLADLIGAALGEVDWREIAAHLVSDLWADYHGDAEEEEETEE